MNKKQQLTNAIASSELSDKAYQQVLNELNRQIQLAKRSQEYPKKIVSNSVSAFDTLGEK